jgi:Zn ribbon nucleic-acid-binding protein
MTNDELFAYPCPQCGGRARSVGAYNDIERIECETCGYQGDHFEEVKAVGSRCFNPNRPLATALPCSP